MKSSSESFVAFFSYVRLNDEHDRGKLTLLRKLLQTELWVQAGRQLPIFQDQENLEWGRRWMDRITDVLSSCSILIAVVTPSYLLSRACRFEFEYFLAQESQLKRKIILPVLYIDTPGLKDTNDNIAVEISKHQWVDWRDLRFTSLTSTKTNKKLASMAKRIWELVENNDASLGSLNTVQNNTPPDSVVRATTGGSIHPGVDAYEIEKIDSIYIPIDKSEDDKNSHLLTVDLRTTGDIEQDKRRIKTIYGTLISFHGRDRFSFQVFENQSSYLIDFPQDTTRVCPELLDRLKKLIGEENWRVEALPRDFSDKGLDNDIPF